MALKIKFQEAEKFIASFGKVFAGKEISSFEVAYRIKGLVFEEGEILASLELVENPQSPLTLVMSIERAAELLEISIDWKAHGFRSKGKE
jgi:hypothetical protein